MNGLITFILWFVVSFIVVYFVYTFIFEDMIKKEKFTKISELELLTHKFNLDKKKIDIRKLLNGVSIINGFIMGITIAFLCSVDLPTYLWLPLAFVIMIILIYCLYTMYGKMLNKKWGIENDK